MKGIWEPIVNHLVVNHDLVTLLKHSEGTPKVLRSFQEIFPNAPFLVLFSEEEKPIVLGAGGVPTTILRIAVLANNERELESISSLLIELLDHFTTHSETSSILWTFWEGVSLPPTFEEGQWREDLDFRLASREEGA
jgi:hypothetical protein